MARRIHERCGVRNGKVFQQQWRFVSQVVRVDVAQLPQERPQLLVLDGHFAHLDFHAIKMGLDNDVHIFVLPTQTSHFLQPLDVNVYLPFKRLYENKLKVFPDNHGGELPCKDDFAAVTKEEFEKAVTEKNVRLLFLVPAFPPSRSTSCFRALSGMSHRPTNPLSKRSSQLTVDGMLESKRAKIGMSVVV